MKYNQYQKILKDVRAGDILLIHHNKAKILPRIIEELDDCIYSHVMVMITDEDVLDIDIPIAKSKKLSNYLNDYRDFEVLIIRPDFTEEERQCFIGDITSLVGKFYNIFQLIGFLISYGIGWLRGKQIDNPFGTKNMVICSSISTSLKRTAPRFDLSIYEESGDKHMISPADFHHIALSAPCHCFALIYKTS